MAKGKSPKEIKNEILLITAKKRKSFSMAELSEAVKGVSKPKLQKYIRELVNEGWLEEIKD
jgi:Fic family protein